MRGLAEVCVFVGLVCAVIAAREKPKIHTRPILADELRDFPGVCFASTQCGTVEVGRSWDLSPFCGRSTCAKSEDGRLVEVVEDCGPGPKGDCRVDTRRTNTSAPFPDCCPVYDCEGEGEAQPEEDYQTEPPRSRAASRRKHSRHRDQ